MCHWRRTKHKTRTWASIIQLLCLFYWNQCIFLTMNYKSWTLHLGHSAQIIKLVRNQKTEESHFASRYVFNRRQRRHQYKSTWLKLGRQMRCRPATQWTTQNYYVLLPQISLFYDKSVSEFCISVNLLLWWAFRIIVNPISWVLDGQHVDLERSPHMVKHLIRYTNIFGVSMEEDY